MTNKSAKPLSITPVGGTVLDNIRERFERRTYQSASAPTRRKTTPAETLLRKENRQ